VVIAVSGVVTTQSAWEIAGITDYTAWFVKLIEQAAARLQVLSGA
jgi:hypothetical protein